MTDLPRRPTLSALLLATLGLCAGPTQAATLDDGFAHPPLSARPRVYWYWVNGNLSREGLTQDLEAMKRIGMGGAMMMEVACGVPAGTVKTNTPQWNELVNHAVREASRLNLQLAFGNGTGWSGSQGPWVKPEYSMQQTVYAQTTLHGPCHFKGVIPQPPARLGFYRDIALLAVPALAGENATQEAMHPMITSSPVGEKRRVERLDESRSPSAPTLNSDVQPLFDGDLDTVLRLSRPKGDEPVTITFEYPAPFTARSLSLTMGFWLSCQGQLQVSDDGKDYRTVRDFSIPSAGPVSRAARTIAFSPVTARWFRLLFPSMKSKHSVETLEIAEVALHGGDRVEGWESKCGIQMADTADKSPSQSPKAGIEPSSLINLTSRLTPDGQVEWDVPAGDWTVLRLGHTSCSVPYDTPPKWAQGLETDTMSRAAMDEHWKAYMQPILDRAAPETRSAISAVHTDSWEAGSQNWTADFPQEFRRRRGYDLTPYLPALTGRIVGNEALTQRFYWDMRRTIADLMADNYYGGLADLAHARGLKFTTEAYGNACIDALECAGRSDIPMTEIWTREWTRKPEENWYLKWGSSPAHVYGRTLVGAESFTTSPDRTRDIGRYLDHPFSVKSIGDNHLFCGGVNLFSVHVYAHQPWATLAPGMTVSGYGMDFNRHQTWWEQSRVWVDYLSRSSYLLQQGLFVGDAVYFCGERPKGNGPAGRVALSPVLPKGYDYDVCPAEVILKRMAVKDHRIVLPDGMSYRYLIANHGEAMSLPVLEKLRDLVKSGATLIAPRPPAQTPGLSGYPDCDARMAAIIEEMWGNCDGRRVQEHACGEGRVFWNRPWKELLAQDQLPPDFSYQNVAPGDTPPELNYIHRKDGTTDIYFVANLLYQETTCDLAFRVHGMEPEFFHPDTGEIQPVAQWHEENGQIHIPYHFDPAGSTFVIFRKPAHAPASHTGSNWLTLQPIAPLNGPWQLSFNPKVGGPAQSVTFEELQDWSAHADKAIRYYSGTATYRQSFELPAAAAGRRLFLDLGRVAIMAEVKVNAQPCGILWKPPYRAEITSAVKPGRNELEIAVVNQWANRLIGDEQLPEDAVFRGGNLVEWPEWLLKGTARPSGRITLSTHKHYQKGEALHASGLLGPVTLQAEAVAHK